MNHCRLSFLLLVALFAAGCNKADGCDAVRSIGGLFGLGTQHMHDETTRGERYWFWVDAPYPRLALDKVDKVLYTDRDGHKLGGIDAIGRDPGGTATVTSGKSLSNGFVGLGLGAFIHIDPWESLESYDAYTCRVAPNNAPVLDFVCPGLRGDPGDGILVIHCAEQEYIAVFGTTAVLDNYVSCHLIGSGWRRTIFGMGSDGISYDTGRTELRPWPSGAGPRPPYETMLEGARMKFNAMAVAAGVPVAPKVIAARDFLDAEKDWLNSPGCRDGQGPNGTEPTSRNDVPPAGAEPPDQGGVEFPSTTASGGASTGDYP